MNRKGALELSVNAIVTLIIALAVLGLIIGFAVGQFNKVSSKIQITEETPEPTPQNPITIPGGGSELTLSKQNNNGLTVRVYNTMTASISANEAPTVTCTDSATFTVASVSSEITSGNSGEFVLDVDASQAVLGRHACQLKISSGTGDGSEEITKSLFITVE